MTGQLPLPPPDLSADSRARWRGLAADVRDVLGGAETDFELLANVLRAQDRLAQVRAALDGQGPVVTGSMGQVRPHPLLAAETALRREVAAGFDALGLGPKSRWRTSVASDGRLRRRTPTGG